MVLRRGDDRRELGPPLFGLADLHDRHAIGLLVELLQIFDVLRVVDQPVVVADVPAELFLRGGQPGGGGFQRLRRRRREEERQGDGRLGF